MPQLSRRALLAALGTASVAGCSAGAGTGGTGTDPHRTATESPSPTGGTPTADWLYRASNSPDPDHSVYLYNEGTRERTVQVRVVRRASGEAVFDETRTISPGAEREVYNLRRADPDGVEAFEICGRLVETAPAEPATTASDSTATDHSPAPTGTAETPDSPHADCITMETNECFGTAHVTVGEDGQLRVIYSIC